MTPGPPTAPPDPQPFSNEPGSTLMFGSLATLPFLLAQAVAAPGEAPPPLSSQLLQYLPFVPVLLLFYFMIIRPSQVQERKKRTMISQLKKNDRVLTLAGIYGTVVSIDNEGDRVVLKIDEDGKVRVAFARSGIARVLTEGSEKK